MKGASCFWEAQEAYGFVANELGYTPWAVLCYGSQNYQLDTEDSDYDWKAIVLPSLDDILDNKKPVSKVYEFGTGQVDVKDVRLMFSNYQKQNPNFMETLFTPYLCLNGDYASEWREIQAMAERIAYADPVRAMNAMVGMAMEKQHALCHPYESKLPILERYGYDAKQLSHEYRLCQMLTKFIEREEYKSILVPTEAERELLMGIKTYKMHFCVPDAEKMAMDVVRVMQERRDAAFERFTYGVDTAAYDAMNEVKNRVLKAHFVSQL